MTSLVSGAPSVSRPLRMLRRQILARSLRQRLTRLRAQRPSFRPFITSHEQSHHPGPGIGRCALLLSQRASAFASLSLWVTVLRDPITRFPWRYDDDRAIPSGVDRPAVGCGGGVAADPLARHIARAPVWLLSKEGWMNEWD